MDKILIAIVCHQANKALCEVNDDFSQLDWNDAPTDIKRSAIQGVQFRLDNPDCTPEEQHQAWCESKLQDGWKQGTAKNSINKTHPCLVPYSELPAFQRAKDKLFIAIVDALKG
jgi:hypothetical protein